MTSGRTNNDSQTASYDWVDKPAELSALLSDFPRDEILYVDTEADSLHHYREKICLFTLRAGNKTWLVDPMAPLDLAPLWGRLADREWVFHGADYDLRMLTTIQARLPREIFDTMLAGQILGLKGLGYAALVEQFCGVKLNKSSQKEDWSRRPLPEKMLHYAALDVFHLPRVRESLVRLLDGKGRREWHRQTCARLLKYSLVPKAKDDGPPWLLQGASRFSPRALALLKSLWEWREQEAERSDHPSFHIMQSEKLLEMALWAEKNEGKPHVPTDMLNRGIRGSRLLHLKEALNRGWSAEPVELPAPPRRQPRDHKLEQKINTLKSVRDEIAKKLGIDSSVLASKAVLQSLALNPESASAQLIQDLRWCPWQSELMQPAVKKLL